jgi:hypothetical protein
MTRILEVEENGTLTLPSDVLDNARAHTQYILETHGKRLTLRPVVMGTAQPKKSHKRQADAAKKWEEERRKLTEELGQVWPEGVSVVDVISEMRR